MSFLAGVLAGLAILILVIAGIAFYLGLKAMDAWFR